MQGRLMISSRWLKTGECSSTPRGGCAAAIRHELRRVVSKASDRAAVHGSKLPVTDSVDKEEAEKLINKGKEEKETKKREIEKKVDGLDNSSSP